MDTLSNILGIPRDQAENFIADYRLVWSGGAQRAARPALWRIWKENGEVMVESMTKKTGYDLYDALWKACRNGTSPREIAEIIEEIGTPSAIEVAKHIRKDLKDVSS